MFETVNCSLFNLCLNQTLNIKISTGFWHNKPVEHNDSKKKKKADLCLFQRQDDIWPWPQKDDLIHHLYLSTRITWGFWKIHRNGLAENPAHQLRLPALRPIWEAIHVMNAQIHSLCSHLSVAPTHPRPMSKLHNHVCDWSHVRRRLEIIASTLFSTK